jgi:hypothetical protein
MDIGYTDKCRYEIQEQKQVPVSYTGTYRSISSTASSYFENDTKPINTLLWASQMLDVRADRTHIPLGLNEVRRD